MCVRACVRLYVPSFTFATGLEDENIGSRPESIEETYGKIRRIVSSFVDEFVAFQATVPKRQDITPPVPTPI